MKRRFPTRTAFALFFGVAGTLLACVLGTIRAKADLRTPRITPIRDPSGFSMSADGHVWRWTEQLGIAYTIVYGMREDLGAPPAGPFPDPVAVAASLRASDPKGERWPSPASGIDGKSIPSTGDLTSLNAVAVGWPARAGRLIVVWHDNRAAVAGGVVAAGTDAEDIHATNPDGSYTAGVLYTIWPTHPIAFGLGVDLAFFTAVGVVIGNIPAFRRAARRRRGRCAGCGYDRRGLDLGKTCPECGRTP